jgi:hypothetical protein
MPVRAKNANHDRIELSFLIDPSYARNQNWECPLCDEKMSYVSEYQRGPTTINPFFRHQSACAYDYDETPEHHQMKINAARLFTTNNYQDVEFEKKIGENRIADVVINRRINVYNPKKKPGIPGSLPKWVIECENTSNGHEIQQRTLNYNQDNSAVLWLFNSQRLQSIDDGHGLPAKITNQAERFINEINGGSVFYISPENPGIDKVHYSWTSNKWEQKRYLVQGQVPIENLGNNVYAMRTEQENTKYDIVKLSPVRFNWWNQ